MEKVDYPSSLTNVMMPKTEMKSVRSPNEHFKKMFQKDVQSKSSFSITNKIEKKEGYGEVGVKTAAKKDGMLTEKARLDIRAESLEKKSSRKNVGENKERIERLEISKEEQLEKEDPLSLNSGEMVDEAEKQSESEIFSEEIAPVKPNQEEPTVQMMNQTVVLAAVHPFEQPFRNETINVQAMDEDVFQQEIETEQLFFETGLSSESIEEPALFQMHEETKEKEMMVQDRGEGILEADEKSESALFEAKVPKILSKTRAQSSDKLEIPLARGMRGQISAVQNDIEKLKVEFLSVQSSEELSSTEPKDEALDESKTNLDVLMSNFKVSATQKFVREIKTAGTEGGKFDLVARVMDELKVHSARDKTQIHLRLEPEVLGKLTIKLSSENGVMNASFFAENDRARLMIESHMAELKKSLEDQGIQVQNLSVSVDSGQQELSRHKNIMEAQKYSRVKKLEMREDDPKILKTILNPYILKGEFTDTI